MSFLIWLLFACSIPIEFAHAQASEIDIGAPKVLRPEDVTVLENKELEDASSRNSSDALRTVPGLLISTAGGAGQMSVVFIRGANSEGTLVFLDGLSINDPSLPKESP